MPVSSRKKTPRTIAKVLSSRRGGLGALINQSKQHEQLKRQLSYMLPPQLGAHYQVGGIHDGTLVLITDSAAWATKLRFSAPALIRQLQPQGIKHIEIRQRARQTNTVKPAVARKACMSPDAAKQLKSLANTLEDSKLKQALERLAEHANKHTDD